MERYIFMIDQIVVFIIMVLLYKLKKIYGTAELKQLTKEMPYIHMCVRKSLTSQIWRKHFVHQISSDLFLVLINSADKHGIKQDILYIVSESVNQYKNFRKHYDLYL